MGGRRYARRRGAPSGTHHRPRRLRTTTDAPPNRVPMTARSGPPSVGGVTAITTPAAAWPARPTPSRRSRRTPRVSSCGGPRLQGPQAGRLRVPWTTRRSNRAGGRRTQEVRVNRGRPRAPTSLSARRSSPMRTERPARRPRGARGRSMTWSRCACSPSGDTLAARVAADRLAAAMLARLGRRLAGLPPRTEPPGRGGAAQRARARRQSGEELIELHRTGRAGARPVAVVGGLQTAILRRTGRSSTRAPRSAAGRDGHGDLRAEHVLFEHDGCSMVDRLEFDAELRATTSPATSPSCSWTSRRAGPATRRVRCCAAYRAAGGDPGDDALVACWSALPGDRSRRRSPISGPAGAHRRRGAAQHRLRLAHRLLGGRTGRACSSSAGRRQRQEHAGRRDRPTRPA